jgi:hypothetical protein
MSRERSREVQGTNKHATILPSRQHIENIFLGCIEFRKRVSAQRTFPSSYPSAFNPKECGRFGCSWHRKKPDFWGQILTLHTECATGLTEFSLTSRVNTQRDVRNICHCSRMSEQKRIYHFSQLRPLHIVKLTTDRKRTPRSSHTYRPTMRRS